MALVVSLLSVWLTIHVVAALPRKLPLPVNVLLFMAMLIVNANRWTVLSHNLEWLEISMHPPKTMAVVLYRDVTYPLTLIAFANAALEAGRRAAKLAAAAAAFLYLYGIGQALRGLGAIRYNEWNEAYECLLIAAMLAIAYGVGRALRALWRKERNGYEA
ncbi:hypothetical protein [Paenibacillus sp.]|uniref:hypothetical protein n=1 Tax=Paenibacillus sp. TaxID=58172 RepID=UPI002D42F4E9|nr:hypothetical protein [Paenibacillus sp.]HZG85735.1 hypothetical protein [Paenibacillus sp.]